MGSTLPSEIITHILEYIPDIDTRRAFGIYRSIPTNMYRVFEYWLRTPVYMESYGQFQYVRFALPNLYNPPERLQENIEDDRMDFEYLMRSNQVLYDISIHRLKPKLTENVENGQIYYRGKMTDYYWEIVTFGYRSPVTITQIPKEIDRLLMGNRDIFL